jgi:hypothetical protein
MVKMNMQALQAFAKQNNFSFKAVKRNNPQKKASTKKPFLKQGSGRSAGRGIPIAVATTTLTRKASVRNLPDGMAVSHTEYLRDIPTTAAFTAQGIAINAGNSLLFPWLSALALRFESYTFDRLEFKYTPACPTTTPGTIGMVVDFDALDDLPTTKVSFRSYAGAASGQSYAPLVYRALLQQLKKQKLYYVSPGLNPPQSDRKTYDVGQFVYSTDCGPAVPLSCSGELSVSYTVRFYTPQIEESSNTTTSYFSNVSALAPYVNNLVSSATSPPPDIVNISEAPLPFFQSANFSGNAGTFTNVPSITGLQRVLRFLLKTNDVLRLASTYAQQLAGSGGPRTQFAGSGIGIRWLLNSTTPDAIIQASNSDRFGTAGYVLEGLTTFMNLGAATYVEVLPYLKNLTSVSSAYVPTGQDFYTIDASSFASYAGAPYMSTGYPLPPWDVNANQAFDDQSRQHRQQLVSAAGGGLSAAAIWGAAPAPTGPSPAYITIAANVVSGHGLGVYSLYAVVVGTVLTAPTLGAFVGCTTTLSYSLVNAAATLAVARFDITAITAEPWTFAVAITATTVTNATLSSYPTPFDDVQL